MTVYSEQKKNVKINAVYALLTTRKQVKSGNYALYFALKPFQNKHCCWSIFFFLSGIALMSFFPTPMFTA